EAIELPKLKSLIEQIYPNINQLYMITYQLVK
ncbi:MAG: N(4)-acetylcytidine aminohydrolase, partial [Vibrio sp.]